MQLSEWRIDAKRCRKFREGMLPLQRPLAEPMDLEPLDGPASTQAEALLPYLSGLWQELLCVSYGNATTLFSGGSSPILVCDD